MPSLTFTPNQGNIPASWLNDVNNVVWSVFNGATNAASARTALGASSLGSSLFTTADATSARSLLNLGTSSIYNIGTSGATVPLLDGTNTWGSPQTFSGAVSLSNQLNENYTTTASGATVNLGNINANQIEITGTTTITSFGTTGQSGIRKTLRFASILTLTNGASLVLPGGANITTAAGDIAVFVKWPSNIWYCVSYTRAASRLMLRQGSTLTLDPYAINTTTTQAHGLGVTPDLIQCYLECKTGEGNWSIGDRIDFGSWASVATSTTGIMLTKDATNLAVITHSTNLPVILNKTTRATFTITAANWKLIAIPYAVTF